LDVRSVQSIAAIITNQRDAVSGGAPIFFVQDDEERQRVAFLIGRLLDGMVHDLGNGIFIVVKY